jgi:hypothetical protein
MQSMPCNVDLGTNSACVLGPRKTTENLTETLIELAGHRTFQMCADY